MLTRLKIDVPIDEEPQESSDKGHELPEGRCSPTESNMQDLPRQISGSRELTAENIALINRIKEAGKAPHDFLKDLQANPMGCHHRWISRGSNARCHTQTIQESEGNEPDIDNPFLEYHHRAGPFSRSA